MNSRESKCRGSNETAASIDEDDDLTADEANVVRSAPDDSVEGCVEYVLNDEIESWLESDFVGDTMGGWTGETNAAFGPPGVAGDATEVSKDEVE